MRFQGKVVLITGGAGGIGKAAARLFAQEGARLALVDLNKADLDSTVSELGLDEKDCLVLPADVSREEEVKAYVKQTLNSYGQIDVFFNNAGVEGKFALIHEVSAENLENVLGVNIKGVFYGLKHVLPTMTQQRKGSIINTSSVAGLIGSAGLAPYVASKHAVLGLTKSAALEGAINGVRVNAVCPGPINNRMMRSIEEGAAPGNASVVRSQFEEKVPLHRYGESAEVAELVLFLASDQASYITGAYYLIDGGMIAT